MKLKDIFKRSITKLQSINKFDRSFRDGYNLTVDEVKWIANHGTCPDCHGDLLEGPSGGMSTNYYCSKCTSRYNITILSKKDAGFGNQRISDSSLWVKSDPVSSNANGFMKESHD